jgi:hypothetical protein
MYIMLVVGTVVPQVAIGDIFLTRKVTSKRILTEKEEWWRPMRASYAAWNFGSEFTTWHRIKVSSVVSGCDGFLWLDGTTEGIMHKKN